MQVLSNKYAPLYLLGSVCWPESVGVVSCHVSLSVEYPSAKMNMIPLLKKMDSILQEKKLKHGKEFSNLFGVH